MNRSKYSAIIMLFSLLFTNSAHAETDPLSQLAWQVGPTEGVIGDKARIDIPNGYVFLGASDTKKFMELNQNLAGDNEYLFAPSDLHWFAVFTFSSVGYVKDDETLDPRSLLDSVTSGTEQGNIERRKRGWSTLSILGWRFQPRYDRQLNLLEWAFLAKV